jgi:molybdopterin converting factor small subunit
VERDAVRVRVDYYAYFRDKRGLASETVETEARTLGDLYCELAEAHGFRLPISSVRAVVGDEFAPMEGALSEGDVVAYVPPVAGG